jgi:N-acylneuraminate cytidylyltransferase
LKEFKIQKSSQSNRLFTVSRNEHKLWTIVQDRFIPMNYKVGQRSSQDLASLFGILYICEAKQITKRRNYE